MQAWRSWSYSRILIARSRVRISPCVNLFLSRTTTTRTRILYMNKHVIFIQWQANSGNKHQTTSPIIKSYFFHRFCFSLSECILNDSNLKKITEIQNQFWMNALIFVWNHQPQTIKSHQFHWAKRNICTTSHTMEEAWKKWAGARIRQVGKTDAENIFRVFCNFLSFSQVCNSFFYHVYSLWCIVHVSLCPTELGLVFICRIMLIS